MKKIEAIVRHSKVEEVKKALHNLGITTLTLVEVESLGYQEGYVEFYRGKAYQVDFVSKFKIELIVEDDVVDTVLDHICSAARTGIIGDGKIIISPVEKIIRIRTAEEDSEAL